MVFKSWFGAALLAMSLFLGGCFPTASTQDEEKNPYFVAGKDRAAARDYKGAIEAFEKALEVNPRSALAHYELGVLYEQHENDYPAAIYHYSKVLKLRPHNAYPAQNARQRIPGCKLEMLKDDTLATLNPTAMREIERLRKENQQLRQYLEGWADWWKRNSVRLQQTYAPRQTDGASTTRNHDPDSERASANHRTRSNRNESRSSTDEAASAPGTKKIHRIKKGETLMALSRRYRVSLSALRAANPGLDPRHMLVGQSVNIP